MSYKSLNGLVPTYLSDLLQLHVPSRSLRSAGQLLSVAFAAAAPKLWDESPLHVRLAAALSVFKSHFKTHFCSLAFDSV